MLLLLLLQPTPPRLPARLAQLLEKYTWGEHAADGAGLFKRGSTRTGSTNERGPYVAGRVTLFALFLFIPPSPLPPLSTLCS